MINKTLKSVRRRKVLRLKNFDYGQNYHYFVTICPKDRFCYWFGEIIDNQMVLNKYGQIVQKQWQWLGKQYDYIKLGQFCVMPDHVHGIIEICGRDTTDDDISHVGAGRDTTDGEMSHVGAGRDTTDGEMSHVGAGRDTTDGEMSHVGAGRDTTDGEMSHVGAGRDVGATLGSPLQPHHMMLRSLSQIVCAFKTTTSKHIRQNGAPHFVWQRSFYDTIIRDQKMLKNINQYIKNNPRRWWEKFK